MSSKIYLIDTNILIEAKNRYYAFPLCPGFWDALIYHDSRLNIQSIDKVKEEINNHKIDDDLKTWVNNTIPDSFFNSTEDEDVLSHYREIINWVQANNQFKPEAKSAFIEDKCDPYLIAHAKSNDCFVVTHEAHNPEAEARVPIPNVCHEFNVKCKNTFEMLRELGTQFVLRRDED